jgi:hypothetical protein
VFRERRARALVQSPHDRRRELRIAAEPFEGERLVIPVGHDRCLADRQLQEVRVPQRLEFEPAAFGEVGGGDSSAGLSGPPALDAGGRGLEEPEAKDATCLW